MSLLDPLRRMSAWLGGHGNLYIASLLVIVAGTWGFVALADEVSEGDTQQFDEWAVRKLRQPDTDPAPDVRPEVPLGPKWLREVGRDITGLGGVAVLTFVTASVAGYLILVRKYNAMWLVLASTIGAFVLSTVLKGMFGRPRPDVSHFSYVYTSSFPSGHSMLSAAVYLTLGSLLARLVEGRLVKFYVLAMATLLTLAVGLSRIYMGVHYPTDVLAGWTAGLIWAIFCWTVARHLQRRGAIERDVDPPALAAQR